jgi:hypothetical protein
VTWHRIAPRRFPHLPSRLTLLALLLPVLAAATLLDAQVSYTSMPLDQGFGALDKTPPAIAPEKIISTFAAKTTTLSAAR